MSPSSWILPLVFELLGQILDFAGDCDPEDAEELAKMTREWTILYLDLGFKMVPYVHLLHLHLPESVRLLGGQDSKSGELVELKNSSIKATHLRRTNRKNPLSTLHTQLRVEYHERENQLKEIEDKGNGRRKERAPNPSVGEKNRLRESESRQREDEERRRLTESTHIILFWN